MRDDPGECANERADGDADGALAPRQQNAEDEIDDCFQHRGDGGKSLLAEPDHHERIGIRKLAHDVGGDQDLEVDQRMRCVLHAYPDS